MPVGTVSPTSSAAPNATSSGMLLNYTPAPLSHISNFSLDCPNIDGTNFSPTTNNQLFKMSCFSQYTGATILTALAYSVQDCVNACGSINDNNGTNGKYCQYLVWNAYPGRYQENCWLLSASATFLPDSKPSYLVTAKLQS